MPATAGASEVVTSLGGGLGSPTPSCVSCRVAVGLIMINAQEVLNAELLAYSSEALDEMLEACLGAAEFRSAGRSTGGASEEGAAQDEEKLMEARGIFFLACLSRGSDTCGYGRRDKGALTS